MFDKYLGFINLDTVLENEYGYIFDGNLSSFYKQPFIELEGIGKDALCWIIVNDEKFLFKPLDDFSYNMWGELLAEAIAKKLGIPCAEYRVCELHGKKGVISKNILNKGDTLIVGSEIFQDFFNRIVYHNKGYQSLFDNEDIVISYNIPLEFKKLNVYDQKRYTFNYLNNVKQVYSIFNSDPNISGHDVSEIMLFLINMLLFDLITLQGDRHPNNWGIIENSNHIKPSTLFDNTVSFGLGVPNIKEHIIKFREELINSLLLKDKERIYSIIYQIRPNFTLSETNVINSEKRIKDRIPKVLEDLMNTMDFVMQRHITDVLLTAQKIDLNEVIEDLEIKNGIKMNEDIYYYVTNIFELNIVNLNNIVKKYWEGAKNNGQRKSNK